MFYPVKIGRIIWFMVKNKIKSYGKKQRNRPQNQNKRLLPKK